MRGLALQGGGAKGAYQAGAIKALEQRGIYFDCVTGTSIGAINAAFYASNNLESMYKLWKSIDSKEIFGFESKIIEDISNGNISKDVLLKGYSAINKIIKNKGVDLTNIRKILTDNINEKKLRKSKIDFGLATFNITDFKPIEIFKKDIPEGKLIDYIIASAYLPGLKQEKIIDDKYYFDGGIFDNCPINTLIDKGYDQVYAIRAWEGTKIKYKKTDKTKVIVIGSKEKLGSILDFSPTNAQKKINMGYYDTLKVIDKLDGEKYYIKKRDEKYYTNLFDINTLKLMKKKYSVPFVVRKNKRFIIDILEKACDELKVKKYTIYDTPLLITKLKYLMVVNKKSIYYQFIDEIKVKF